jgi:branched-subunit amino acid aminotransferase/4-amino-4-deoxychorismate lyase
MPDTILTWHPDDGFHPDADAGRPLAVDSWLVQEGRVRGLDLHRQRFAATCREIGVPGSLVTPFWPAAVRLLPRRGEWFPRVELLADQRLRLRIRPAPERGTEIRVWLPDRPDPRRLPRRKGPDLDLLGDLRGAAHDAGADDALLVRDDGMVLESGTAGLVWWTDNRLCVPDPTLPVLPSVTARLIRERAAQLDIEVVPRRVHVKDLADRETWLVNALHGIRPVTAWVGQDIEPGPAVHAPDWRRWWHDLAVAI